jgi:hypothetical protein
MQLPMTVATLSGSRSKRLYDELAFAVSRTDAAVLRQWGGRSSSGRLMNLGARRVGGLATAVGKGGGLVPLTNPAFEIQTGLKIHGSVS